MRRNITYETDDRLLLRFMSLTVLCRLVNGSPTFLWRPLGETILPLSSVILKRSISPIKGTDMSTTRRSYVLIFTTKRSDFNIRKQTNNR